jgi:hypothetical protein
MSLRGKSPWLAASLALIALLAARPIRLDAQRGVSPTRQTVDSLGRISLSTPRWSFWLQNSWAAAELLALMFAGYQLWIRREERRRAEAEAAALAHKAANYQAWTVVNSAQGKGGSGGRIDALQDLNRNTVSLAGVRLDGAWLTGIDLRRATLCSASFREANLRGADFEDANLEYSDFGGADLTGANLKGAILKHANFAGARLGLADLRGANLADLRGWQEIAVASYLQCGGTREAPAEFLAWAFAHGAVEQDSDAMLRTAERSYSQHFRTT